MNNSTRFLPFLSLLLFIAWGSLSAQNISITYQNPDGLYVCGTDEMSVTLTNTGSTQLADVKATVILPAGITYVAGSVQSATESNIGNPNVPVFNVTDIPVGASRTFRITVKAGCDLVAKINSGQLFSNQIKVSYNGGTGEATTQLFKVETGLLIITSVVPLLLSGEFGDTLTRKITVRNTREGPISGLSFTDLHTPGIDITILNVGGTMVNGQLFQATISGSTFSTIGDGDNLLENNEELMLTERIIITKCLANASKILSDITVGWGCDGMICQVDTISAEVEVLPSSKLPHLVFVPKYSVPSDQCGQQASIQEVTITNDGQAPTTGISILLFSQDTFHLGIDGNSFEYNIDGTGWTPATL